MFTAEQWTLGQARVHWEAQLNPFTCPDPWCFEGSLVRESAQGTTAEYEPEPFQTLDTAREVLPRPRAGLGSRDATCLHAALALARVEERMTPADAGLLPQPGPHWLRSPYSELPLDQAAGEHARGRREAHQRRLAAHRWWLRADLTNLAGSVDRGLLLQSLRLPPGPRRVTRRLLEHLGLGPRRGLRGCGRAMHLLARAYLDPVVQGLRGYEFLHTDLDEFHFYCADRPSAQRALDRLTRLLEPLALHVNYQKTFLISAERAQAQELRARFDLRFVHHRVAAAASASLHPWVVRTLAEPLYSEAFLYRRPGYRALARTPAGRAAFAHRLSDPALLPGDRARLELFLKLHA